MAECDQRVARVRFLDEGGAEPAEREIEAAKGPGHSRPRPDLKQKDQHSASLIPDVVALRMLAAAAAAHDDHQMGSFEREWPATTSATVRG
jgi:hypothetical protein